MRKLVLLAVAGAALVLTGASLPAASVTKTVKITSTAFSPATVTIATADAVKWTNKDTKTHQVVANNGAFASPIIAAGHAWTHRFNTAGTSKYHDALHPALTGKVVLTGANGAWALTVTPALLTTYQAHWKSTVSAPIMVAVHPHVGFTAGRRYAAVKVKAGRSMQGRKVYIQRFTRFHEWVKIRKVVLNGNSGARFRLRLSPGRYTLRAYITINQAGAGYLDGASHTIVLRRR